MTILHESIKLERPPREVFAYVSDFSSSEQWDSTVIHAKRLNDGPISIGSRFHVVCAGPIGRIPLEYEITDLVQDEKIVLIGRSRFFQVTDTIAINATDSGSELDYTASFEWQPPLGHMASLMQRRLEKMGHKSVQQGLKKALEDQFQAPQISPDNARADRYLITALSRFSKYGFQRGRKRWNPVSAYMGDKHVVLTGATDGLGKACAYSLARLGAQLTLVVRNADKGKALVQSLQRDTGNRNIDLEIADLSLMADVDRVITNLNHKAQSIDALINNAGALFNPRQLTSEGLEQSFALLLLSPYRLTEGLRPLLQSAAKTGHHSRVINVVSGGMYSQRLRVGDLQSERGKYSGSVAYARCKRALMIMTEHWAKDWASDKIVVNAMHPGWADTPGVVSALPRFHKITKRILRSPEEGADTITWLTVASEAAKVSGKLFLDREPRTTHLLESTRESAESRNKLRDILAHWKTPETSAKGV